MGIVATKEYKYSGMLAKLHKEVVSQRGGEQLLSEPELAQKFGVSRGTARKALKKLEEYGCIIRKQGQGTFVSEADKNLSARGEYAFLAFHSDNSGAPYIFNQLKGIEKIVSEQNSAVTFKSADDKSLTEGNLSRFFNGRDNVRGILVDGNINNMHLHAIEAMGFPLVVMGNHDISAGFPQIRYDFSLLTELVCQYLLSLDRGPVKLFIDDTRLFYYNQMIKAYNKTMLKNEEIPTIYTTNEYEYKQVFGIIKSFTDKYKDQFCLYIADNLVHYVLQAIDWLGYSDSEIPIIALGSGLALKDEHLRRIKLIRTDPYMVGQKATEILMRIIKEHEKCYGVFLPELDIKSTEKFGQFEFCWHYKTYSLDSRVTKPIAGIMGKHETYKEFSVSK